jgi:hypothetical protein
VKRIDGSLVMGPEYVAGTLVELMQRRETPSGTDRVLHDPPEAFDGIEVVPTMSREEVEAKLTMVVRERCVKLVRSMDTTAVTTHDDLFACFAKDTHALMEILASRLGVTVGDNCREDFRRPILDGTEDTPQHAAGDPAPRAILHPGLTFETFVACDLTLAQRTGGETRPLGAAPPAPPGEGKAPQDGFIFVKHNDLTPACPILQGSEVDGAVGEVGGGGSEPPGGTAGAYRVFLHTPRTLSRPSWTPVSRAKTAASARQLHWAEIEPCGTGS